MSRRRTLIANEIPNLQFETDVVDDEAEKRRRMSERFDSATINPQVQRRLQQSRLNRQDSTTPGINKTPTLTASSAAPKPSNEQLSCLYNNCVKLLNENKINVKNAFQLKLIDYMSDIVLNSEISGGVTNFQVVGCTIDVGSKIYAARVDALHQNTYQVLSGLNNQAAETGADGEVANVGEETEDLDNLDENDEDPNSKKAKAAKKRRLKKSSHIVLADNIDSITLKMRDEYKDEDLYFSKKSTCIENEAIGGILLNKLCMKNDTLAMLISADDRQYEECELARHSCDTMDFKAMFEVYEKNACDLKNIKLCSDLSNFKFIDYHLDENSDVTKLVDSMIAADVEEGLEAHRFDANNLQLSRYDVSIPYAADNIDMDDVNDYDVENMDIDGDLGAPKLSHHVSGLDLLDDMKVMNSIADLSTLISHSPSDYSYFNFDKLKMLNLPRHLKQIAHSIQSERGPNYDPRSAVVQKNAKATKRAAPRIDFSAKLDNSKFFKITKKAVFLCDRTIEKRSEKPCRLETERQYNYEARELFRPYLKPITAKIINDPNSVDLIENLLNSDEALGGAPINISNARGPADDDDDLGGIDDDFEIPGTVQNEPFFTQGGGEFVQSQQIEMMQANDDMNAPGDLGNLSRFDGDNLIQAPMQVNALNIEYAKTSKNIDVRRLKQVIWNLLCTNSDGSDKENIDKSASEGKEASAAVSVNASLKQVYKQLIPPLISQKVYDDLSICIVFQMILFLANEHNLLLKNDAMGFDVQITNY